jgi:hypothetical protein
MGTWQKTGGSTATIAMNKNKANRCNQSFLTSFFALLTNGRVRERH